MATAEPDPSTTLTDLSWMLVGIADAARDHDAARLAMFQASACVLIAQRLGQIERVLQDLMEVPEETHGD